MHPGPDHPAGEARRPDAPDFGPPGYLPERAARRARKIILREQMGLQWPVAAVLAALVVALAGGVYLATGTGAPDPPAQPVLDIADVDPRGAQVLAAGDGVPGYTAPADHLAVVRAGGGVRVLRLPSPEIVWCPASGRLESPAGQVWTTNGRLVGGNGTSLAPLAAIVHDGVLYVDETAAGAPPPPDPREERPTCAA